MVMIGMGVFIDGGTEEIVLECERRKDSKSEWNGVGGKHARMRRSPLASVVVRPQKNLADAQAPFTRGVLRWTVSGRYSLAREVAHIRNRCASRYPSGVGERRWHADVHLRPRVGR